MNIINGKDVILYFTYNGLDQVICCAQSCTLNTNANIGETSTLNSGKWKTFIGVNLEWDGVCEGLCSLDANISISQIRTVQFSLQPIAIKFVSTDSNGLTEIFSSTCIITKVTNGGTAGTPSNYSVEIKGIGDIGSEVSVTVPPGCEVLWYYYDGVGGEYTTGPIATLAGNDIDGFIFRDGIQYRPSGALHDGSGTPIGKEFSYDKTTGAIGFDTTLPALEIGEHLDIPYLVCADTGGGGDCVAVTIEPNNLPDAEVGVPYSYAITLDGDGPFSLAPGVIKPTWMTVFIDGNLLKFTGTPPTAGTNLQVSLTVTNCDGANSDSLSDSIDVIVPGDAHFNATTFVSSDGLNDSEVANLAGVPGSTLTITVTGYTNTNGGQLQANGIQRFLGNTFTVTMDGTGHGSFTADIFGLAGVSGSIILGRFMITAVSSGTIGSPDTFQTSKVFS